MEINLNDQLAYYGLNRYIEPLYKVAPDVIVILTDYLAQKANMEPSGHWGW